MKTLRIFKNIKPVEERIRTATIRIDPRFTKTPHDGSFEGIQRLNEMVKVCRQELEFQRPIPMMTCLQVGNEWNHILVDGYAQFQAIIDDRGGWIRALVYKIAESDINFIANIKEIN